MTARAAGTGKGEYKGAFFDSQGIEMLQVPFDIENELSDAISLGRCRNNNKVKQPKNYVAQ